MATIKPKSQQPRLYERVDFAFACLEKSEPPSILTSSVRLEPSGMVLEMTYRGDHTYLLRGRRHDSFYEASTSGPDGPVNARWTAMENTYVGTWVEAGYDYLFSFELPRDAVLPPS